MAARTFSHHRQCEFSALPNSSRKTSESVGSARVSTSSVAEYCSMRCGVPRATNQRSTPPIVDPSTSPGTIAASVARLHRGAGRRWHDRAVSDGERPDPAAVPTAPSWIAGAVLLLAGAVVLGIGRLVGPDSRAPL